MTKTNLLESLFVGLIGLQFLIIATHDWINIPRWVNGPQVQAVVGRKKLAWATLVNLCFPGLALALAIRFLDQPKSPFVLNYWLVYTGITVGSAVTMWWIPYLFGSASARAAEYQQMYLGTRYVLPPRHGSRGPNAAHLVFHALFLATFTLAVFLKLGLI